MSSSFSQSGARQCRWCQAVPGSAEWCQAVPGYAGWCQAVPSGTGWMNGLDIYCKLYIGYTKLTGFFSLTSCDLTWTLNSTRKHELWTQQKLLYFLNSMWNVYVPSDPQTSTCWNFMFTGFSLLDVQWHQMSFYPHQKWYESSFQCRASAC